MVATRGSERETEDAPTTASTEGDERDLAAEDVAPSERRAVKAAMMICGACGAQVVVPEP